MKKLGYLLLILFGTTFLSSCYDEADEVLEIDHLYAVTGISMGGMQTYQWMASYPAFFDKAIPIVGTPKLSIYDGLSYEIFKDILRNAMGRTPRLL